MFMKVGNVLFNNTLNTFYLRLCGTELPTPFASVTYPFNITKLPTPLTSLSYLPP